MGNNTKFFVTSLIAVMAVSPAFAETNATREWVKAQVYDKYIVPQGNALNTINSRLATDVRDKIYTYDTNKDSPTYRQVLDPLNTEATTAFSGINEVLEKVDGNNGTSNSAVQLKTTAQNAFGAINELKDEMPTKTSDLTNDSGFLTSHQDISGKANVDDVYTKTAADDKFMTISDANSTFLTSASLDGFAEAEDVYTKTETNNLVSGKANSADVYTKTAADAKFVSTDGVGEGIYVYTSDGWSKVTVKDTFPDDDDIGG